MSHFLTKIRPSQITKNNLNMVCSTNMYNRIIFSSTLIIYRLLLNESPSISFRSVGLIFSSAAMLSMKICSTAVFVAHLLAVRHRLGASVFIHHLGSPQSLSSLLSSLYCRSLPLPSLGQLVRPPGGAVDFRSHRARPPCCR